MPTRFIPHMLPSISACLMCIHRHHGKAHQWSTSEQVKKNNKTMIFPFPIFQLWFVCCIRIFSLSSVSSKKRHKWIDAVKSRIPFLCRFRIIFYCFRNIFFPSREFYFGWVMYVLNHSLLTDKVCLNKHVAWCVLVFFAILIAFIACEYFVLCFNWQHTGYNRFHETNRSNRQTI